MKNTIVVNTGNPIDHQCHAAQVGDEVIFTCPLCPDYEHRVNLKTGKMESFGTADNPFTHNGSHIKAGLDDVQCSMN